VASVRRFSRFYTRRMGALAADFLGVGATLGEARLLFEIAQQEQPGGDRPAAATVGGATTASGLREALGLDPGQLSRMLRALQEKGWIVRQAVAGDRRALHIALTAEGQRVYRRLDRRQHAAVAGMVDRLGPSDRAELRAALAASRALLGGGLPGPVALRPVATGDLARLAARQSVLYAESHGWGHALETLVTETAARFLRDFKPGRDAGWIADADGLMLGSVLLTDEGGGQARLRLLYVEPLARGQGIGDRLVGCCTAFARQAGYRSVTLWTHTVLEAARRLYARHGFVLKSEECHEAFGVPVQGETWLLDLSACVSKAGLVARN